MKTIHRPIKQQQSIPLARPYNVYNIFFILERARIIQQFCAQDAPIQPSSSPSINFFGYELLSLPDLPPRYCDLILPPDWFVPGKNAKRKHVATNGLRNFTSLARTVASNWQAIDEVTFSYCNSVAQRIKERYAELLSQACCGGFQQNKQSKQDKTTTKAQSPTRAVNADEEDAEEEEEEEEEEDEDEDEDEDEVADEDEDEVADGEDVEEDTDEEDTDEEEEEAAEDAAEEERSPDRTPQFPDNTITASDVLLTLSNMPAAVTPTSLVPTIFHGQHAGSTLTHSDVFLGERSSEQSAHDDIVQIENCHDILQRQWLNDPLPLEQVADVHHWWVKYGNFEDFFAVDV